eukprot:11679551-Alexandrium_andersonii.AAC.1
MVLRVIAKRCSDIRAELSRDLGRHSTTFAAMAAFCSFVELWAKAQGNSCSDIRFMLRTVELGAAEGQVKDAIKDTIDEVIEMRTVQVRGECKKRQEAWRGLSCRREQLCVSARSPRP